MLIRKEGMGWPDNEARPAVRILNAGLPARSGAGLESSYNDDVTQLSSCKGLVCSPEPCTALTGASNRDARGLSTCIRSTVHALCTLVITVSLS